MNGKTRSGYRATWMLLVLVVMLVAGCGFLGEPDPAPLWPSDARDMSESQRQWYRQRDERYLRENAWPLGGKFFESGQGSGR